MFTQKEALHMTTSNDFQANILIADPDETLGELLDVSLREFQHDVRIVRNGLEAFEVLREEEFDLAIMEFALPGNSALEILTRLKKASIHVPHTMILSTGGTLETIHDCVEAGAQDFIVKPFKLPTLIKRISVILARVGLERQKR